MRCLCKSFLNMFFFLRFISFFVFKNEFEDRKKYPKRDNTVDNHDAEIRQKTAEFTHVPDIHK